MEPVPETREALDELARYANSELAATLARMGERAKSIVPECVGLSLGILEDGLTFTLDATSDDPAILDAMQYLDGGPCVAAVEGNAALDIEQADLLDENRWLLFAQASAAAGVASSLSLPILDAGRVVGSVNLYASTPDAFHGRYDELANALDASAEGAVANADLEFSTRLKALEAPARLAEQQDVDLAVGIIVSTQDVDAATARERLRSAAARAGITEAQAARAVQHLA